MIVESVLPVKLPNRTESAVVGREPSDQVPLNQSALFDCQSLTAAQSVLQEAKANTPRRTNAEIFKEEAFIDVWGTEFRLVEWSRKRMSRSMSDQFVDIDHLICKKKLYRLAFWFQGPINLPAKLHRMEGGGPSFKDSSGWGWGQAFVSLASFEHRGRRELRIVRGFLSALSALERWIQGEKKYRARSRLFHGCNFFLAGHPICIYTSNCCPRQPAVCQSLLPF